MNKNFLLLIIPMIGLIGCTVGPDFKRPDTPQAQRHATLPHGKKLENLEKWWQQLNDPILCELIIKAEKDNPLIDMALAKVNEARANVTVNRAGLYPSLALDASSVRSRSALGTQMILQNLSKIGFDASWELDLFGKNRRLEEAAQARFGANETAWHDARISLAAELAKVYVELRQCEKALLIAEQHNQSRATEFEMMRIKAKVGLASLTDEARAQAAEAESLSAYTAKQGECSRELNRLTVLTGIEPSILQERLASRRGLIPKPNSVDISSIAAQAISQRPDISIAEFNLAAASAEVGVSKAALYPSLTIFGSISTNRVNIGAQSEQFQTWSFGPSLTLPLFNGGRLSANVKAAKARYEYALASYQNTVREAVRDVEDALINLNVANARLQDKYTVQEKNQQLFLAVEARYNVGLSNRIALEEARRAWLQAQDSVATLDSEVVTSWIALYKALGGGWKQQAEQSDKFATNLDAH